MPAEVVMPRLSDSMEEGKVVRWLKKVGDPVQRGEPLAEIETDKAVMEMEAYETGTVDRILVQEGESAPVGEPIAYITPAGEAAPAAAPPPPPPPPATAPPGPTAVAEGLAEMPLPTQPAPPKPSGAEERIKASPIARRLAEEHGIDLSKVRGTGPEGRITREDVELYLRPTQPPVARPAPSEVEAAPKEAPARPPTAPPAPAPKPPAPAAGELVPLSKMQATVAKRMAESKATVPHFYATTEVDMTEAAKLRQTLNETLAEQGIKLSFNDLVVKAAALALRRFPQVNSFYREGGIERHQAINVAIAVALEDGLVTPVIHAADRKSLVQIAADARGLEERARSGRLAAGDYEGATFTVSNMGMFEVDEFLAIINPPQSAILAIGSIQPKPVVSNGQIVVSQRMRASLSADHRVFYGVTAAQYLQEFKRLLQNPLSLLL